ncbi:hypothetical protein PRZ48_005343 [Zasmidium cellare]|uniref:Cytochrome P450 n=1 Tax=Zasmidium cellare TaxID=395010 RepID=A0ABR0ESG3_ZASCE|nr:hypothetical protein PRZ48_005343 [Zasmidium cellare]
MLVLILAIAAILVGSLLREALRPGVHSIPGPFLAKFTDLWRVYKVWDWTFKEDLPSLHKKYNSSLIRVGPQLLSCSDARAVALIYGFHSNFKKSDMVKAMAPVYQGKRQPTMFSAADNQTHARIRRPVAPAYAMSKVIQFEPFVNENVRTFFAKLDELFIQENKPCDYHNWVQYFAFDVVMEMTMSRNLGFMKAGGDVDGVLKQLQKDLDYRGIALSMPLIDRICRLNPLSRFFKPNQSSVFALRCKAMLAERLNADPTLYAKDEEKRPQDFVTTFLEIQRGDPSISDGQLIGYTQANLIAGSDTTAVILRTAIYYALKQPWISQRIVEEVDAKCDAFPVPYRTARFDMPFCAAVVREALRMHFAFIGMMEREVPKGGCEMPDGRILPEGVVIGMHGDLIGRDTSIFGEDADEFNPLRWLKASKESKSEYEQRLKMMNAHDLAFGHGARGCIGRHVAEMEIYKFIPTFFGLLEPTLVQQDKPWNLRQLFVFKQSGMEMNLKWRENKGLETVRT